jgi:hypothetical protein
MVISVVLLAGLISRGRLSEQVTHENEEYFIRAGNKAFVKIWNKYILPLLQR